MTSSNENIFRVTGPLCGARSPVNSPHKCQWRGLLVFSLICAWINGWVNNHEAGDLRRHRAHYDITVMEIAPRVKATGPRWRWVKIGLSSGLVLSGNKPSPDICDNIIQMSETNAKGTNHLWQMVPAKFRTKCLAQRYDFYTTMKY